MLETKHTEYLKVNFTEAETRDHASALARGTRQLAQIELQKKEVVASLKAQAEAQNSEVARLSEYITNGYEYRNVECIVKMDTPEKDRKTIIRIDTGATVRVLRMDDFDKQAVLDFEAKDEQATTAEVPARKSKANGRTVANAGE